MTDPMQDFIRTTLLPATRRARAGRASSSPRSKTRRGDFFVARRVTARRPIELVRSLDMRYHGQEHTVRVPCAERTRSTSPRSNERFHALHEQAYTFRLDSAIEIVNFHVVASSRPANRSCSAWPRRDRRRPAKGPARRRFRRGWAPRERHLRARRSASRACRSHGPAMIEEPAATTVVYPGKRATLDEIGNIVIETGVMR